MKEELKKSKMKTFAKECLLDAYNIDVEKVKKIWADAESVEAFEEMFLNDVETFETTQAWAEISKSSRGHRGRLQEHLCRQGAKCLETISDAGGVKIGNDEFSIIAPNGSGDGDTFVYILDQERKFNSNMANFWSMVKGGFNIYYCDCGNDVAEKIEGKFLIYFERGIVIFEKIN